MEQNSFGDWLRLKRKSFDLTREGLAGRVGCSAATIRKIEAEERRPSAQIVERLAQIFNIPLHEQTAFLRFARGDWRSAPTPVIEALPWHPSPKAVSNLPADTTSLIGRAAAIHQVCAYCLERGIRLVTLVGPPGIGKTRLSIAAARVMLPDFPDGIFFVALAPLDNPILLGSTIVQTLGYGSLKNLPVKQQLMQGIGDKRMLLVLDNCEHLVEEVASLASDLMSSCPQLKILATSRESLRIAGEWLYPVPALNTPKENSPVSIESATEYPALMLFAERAHAVQTDFSLDIHNIATVSSICTRLDGLPLAIELIAARIRLMTPQALLEHLKDQFIRSADGMRTANMRQKTLNNAIGWSYNLLSMEEQTLFARLAVFSGGFTLAAAEAIFSRTDPRRSISDLVTSLLDKSLLQRGLDPGGDLRFIQLVTIQQFGLNCLRHMGDEVEVRTWHLCYFLDLAVKADQEMKGPGQIEWLGRLRADRDNLNAALSWMIESGQTENALKMARSLFWFWFRHSDLNDCRHWLGRVVALPDASLFPEQYAEALSYLANNYWLQTGPKEARPFVERALAVARANGDKHNIAQALLYLGLVLTNEFDFTTARATLEESRALFCELGDEWEESAHVILCLALGPLLQKDWAASLALHEQALAGFRKLGDLFFQAVCLRLVGKLQVKQGNLVEGTAALKEALLLGRKLDSKYEIAAILLSLGEAAQSAGYCYRAVQLYWAAKNIYVAVGAWLLMDAAEFEDNLEACRAALGEAEFSNAVALWRGMTMEQAIPFALAQGEK